MVSLNYALGIAQEFCVEIEPFCAIQPEVVGSIRRKKPEVGDIDILVIPKFEDTPDDTLFGKITPLNLLEKQLASMCFESKMKIEANGEKIKRFSDYADSGLSIDLYIATPETLPTLRLIRTGSKGHNIKLCMRAKDLRMQLKADGQGLFDAQLKKLPVDCEEDIFKLLELEYVPPEKRF